MQNITMAEMYDIKDKKKTAHSLKYAISIQLLN